MYLPKQVLPVILLLAAGFQPLQAQQPFETSGLGAGIVTQIREKPLDEYWRLKTGYGVWWNTPFYVGELEFRASLLPHRALNPAEQPDLNNFMTMMTWGFPLDLGGRVRLYGGIQIGNSYFYQRDHGPFRRPESEFSAGAAGRLSVRMFGQTSLQVHLQRTRVYTYHRIDYTWLSFGVGRQFQSPGWLRSFLQ